MRKHKFISALTSVLFLLSLFCLPNTFVSAAQQTDTVRVVTWNIRHGNDQLDGQQAELNAIDADFCLLQEVDEGTGRVNGISCLRTLGRTLYPYRYFGHNMPYDDGEYGLGILSKTRLSAFEQRLQIAGNAGDLGLTKGIGKLNGEKISIYNAHFSYESDLLRARQIQAAAQLLAADENPYKILGGDLNIKSFSELAPFADFGIINCEGRYYPTYQGLDWSTQAIDNIIYSADTLYPSEVKMMVTDYSDHNALAVTFQVKTQDSEEGVAKNV